MNPTLRQTWTAVGLVLAVLSAAQAAPSVSVSSSQGTQYTTTQVSDSTTGAGMAGITVTVCDGAACQASTWTKTGEEAGGAAGDGWSLSLNGNSFDAAFLLNTTRAITSFSMNGLLGDMAFDITPDPETASPGSALGFPFTFFSSSSPEPNEIRVAYSDALSVNDVFYGDLYLVMQVDFNGASFTGRLQFLSDTDTAVARPVGPNPVPEPATLALMAAALLCLAASRRRFVAHG